MREATAEWLRGVPIEDLDALGDVDSRLDAVPGALAPGGVYLRDVWRGRSAGEFVARAINHGFMHVGEMMTVRGLLGIHPQ